MSVDERPPAKFIGTRDLIRKTGWGSSRALRLALLGEIEHRVLPGGVLQYSLADVERVLAETK